MAKINMKELAGRVCGDVPGADSIVKVQKILKSFMVRLSAYSDDDILKTVKRYRRK